MIKQGFVILLIMLGSYASAQRIANFNLSLVAAQGQNTSVLARFSITAGQTCPGYEILHSVDSLNYIPVYSYAGICGDLNVETSYSFLHGGPIPNQNNFYKVNIPGFETSAPQRIFVGNQAAQVNIRPYPNPVGTEDRIRLKFYNFQGGFVEGFIYNQHGIRLLPLYFKVDQNDPEVLIGDLSDGLYILWLTDGNVLFRTKFIVKRP
jgi:hypothetical protein